MITPKSHSLCQQLSAQENFIETRPQFSRYPTHSPKSAESTEFSNDSDDGKELITYYQFYDLLTLKMYKSTPNFMLTNT